MPVVSLCMWLPLLKLFYLRDLNETETSEEVGKKVQLDSETESVSDGMFLILNVLVCITQFV